MKASFYGVSVSDTPKVCIKLLEKSYQLNKKVILIVENQEDMEFFDKALWSSSDWLPHCLLGDELQQEAAVIICRSDMEIDFSSVHADYLFFFNNSDYNFENIKDIEKIFIIFNLKNDIILKYNRSRFLDFKTKVSNLNYYKQDEKGKFIEINSQ